MKEELIFEYMLKEYDILKDFRELIVNQVEERVNLYFKMFGAASSIIPTVLVIISDITTNPNYNMILIVFMSISAVLLYFGYVTFLRVIEGHISIINYSRAINRIRRYFCEFDKSIIPYISMPVTDNTPVFGTYGFSNKKTTNVGVTSLIMVLNSINLFILLTLLFWFISLNIPPITAFWLNIWGLNYDITYTIANLLFPFLYGFLLRVLYKKRMINAEKKAQSRFSKSIKENIVIK